MHGTPVPADLPVADTLERFAEEAQIMAQPTVMKRPVIQDGDRWFLGWDSATAETLLGSR